MKPRLLIALMLMAGLFVSCSQSPEQNPIIQENFQKLADLAEEVDQLKGKIRDIQNDIDSITQDLMTLKQMPKGAEADAAQIDALKNQINKLNSQITTIQKQFSNLKSSGAAQITDTIVKTGDTKSTQPAPTPQKRGQYYSVKPGDTLKSIAEKFSTTPEAIRKENHIPVGKEPIPGSQIYIITE